MHMNCHEQPQGGRPRGSNDDLDQEMARRAIQPRKARIRDSEEFQAWLKEKANAGR